MVPRLKSWRGSCCKVILTAALLYLFLLLPTSAVAVPEVEMTGFKIIQETDTGRWEIRADKAYYDGRGDVILKEVSARMVDKGKESIRVVSDKGRYEPAGLILHLEGNVVVASGRGSRFETPRLKWDRAGAVLVARDGVQLEHRGLKILGRSVKYTIQSGTAEVDGGVQTTWDGRSDLR